MQRPPRPSLAWTPEREAFVGYLEREIDRFQGHPYLQWITALVTIGVFLWQVGPASDELRALPGNQLMIAVGFGALLYLPVSQIMGLLYESARLPIVPGGDPAAARILSKLRRRIENFDQERVAWSLPKWVILLTALASLALAAENPWMFLLFVGVGLMECFRRARFPSTQPRWLRRKWRRVARALVRGQALLWFLLIDVVIAIVFWSHMPSETQALLPAVSLSAFVSLLLLSAHTISWIYLDPTHVLLTQLKHKVAFEDLDIHHAYEAYLTVDAMRQEGLTAPRSIGQLLDAVQGRTKPTVEDTPRQPEDFHAERQPI